MHWQNRTQERANEHVRKNPMLLKCFILFKVEKGCSIWESFKKFCSRYGKDAMSYQEFEFWFMRFSNGEFDMDYDRSLDPKTTAITDLPIEVFEKIAENLNIRKRMIVRKMSKTMQTVMDNINPRVSKLSINTSYISTDLYIDDYCILYSNISDRPQFCKIRTKNGQKLVENKKHWELALNDSGVILKNSKLQLDTLAIKGERDVHLENFKILQKPLNDIQLRVRTIHIPMLSYDSDVCMILILRSLKSGFLKRIVLNIQGEVNRFNLSHIAQTEQFKKIESMEINTETCTNSFGCFKECPYINVHCKQATIGYCETLIQTFVESTALEELQLKSEEAIRPVSCMQCVYNSLGPEFFRVENRPNVRRHKVPRSDQFYEIELTETILSIKRVSCYLYPFYVPN